MQDNGVMRKFETGATRDTAEGKLDFEGFLSPDVLEAFGEYMNENRKQKDGTLRDSDNWQKGIPLKVYMKSGWRHFMQWWKLHRGRPAFDENKKPVDMRHAICGLLFNVMGYLHEFIKAEAQPEKVAPKPLAYPRYFLRNKPGSHPVLYVLLSDTVGRSWICRKTNPSWGSCSWSLCEMPRREAFEITVDKAIAMGLPNETQHWPFRDFLEDWPGGYGAAPKCIVPQAPAQKESGLND